MTDGSKDTEVARYPSLADKAILVTGGASGIGGLRDAIHRIEREAGGAILERQALKFRLDPWHVARVVLFVASAEAGGCTGANFVVDAGVM